MKFGSTYHTTNQKSTATLPLPTPKTPRSRQPPRCPCLRRCRAADAANAALSLSCQLAAAVENISDFIVTMANCSRLSLMATLKLIFLLQTAVLMGHMPFIMRCEPRGLQKKRCRKSFDEIQAQFTDRMFRRVYRMHKSSFNRLYTILQPQLDCIFGGGCSGLQFCVPY